MHQSSPPTPQRFAGSVARLCPELSPQWGPWINSITPTASAAWAAIAPCRACSSMTGMAHPSVKTAMWVLWQCVPDVGRESQTACWRQWASVSMLSVSAVVPAPAYSRGHPSSPTITTTPTASRIITDVSPLCVWAATSPLFQPQAVRRPSEWWLLTRTSTLSVTVVRIVLDLCP